MGFCDGTSVVERTAQRSASALYGSAESEGAARGEGAGAIGAPRRAGRRGASAAVYFICFVCNDGMVFAACHLLFYHNSVYQYRSPVQPINFTSRPMSVQRLSSEMKMAVALTAS